MIGKEPNKRLVRHARSRKFFKAKGRWTKKAERALDFPNLVSLIHACLLHGLKDVELVLCFGDGTPEVSMPLKAY